MEGKREKGCGGERKGGRDMREGKREGREREREGTEGVGEMKGKGMSNFWSKNSGYGLDWPNLQ